MKSLAWSVMAVHLLGGCGAGSHSSGDDDDIVSGDWDGGGGDADVDGDSDGEVDSDSDPDGGTDADAGESIDLPGVGETWTEQVDVDIDLVCEGADCAGPELRVAGGESRGRCARREGFEARMLVANCGDAATQTDTMLAFYYGPERPEDPIRDCELLTAGLIPRGLGARSAVAINFVLTDEEWSVAVAPQGYLAIDPDNLVAECFEANSFDEYPIIYTCSN